jgi:tetratricopeptide (TPR) repeat protein
MTGDIWAEYPSFKYRSHWVSRAFSPAADACGQKTGYGFTGEWADSAIAISNRAISIDSDSAGAYKALALGHECKGWRHKSRDPNRRPVELNPGCFPAVGNLRAYYENTGQSDEALRLWRRALTLDPALGIRSKRRKPPVAGRPF